MNGFGRSRVRTMWQAAPGGWQSAIAKLARERAGELKQLAELLDDLSTKG